MRRIVPWSALGVAFLLSACEDQAAENVTNIQVPSGDPYHERLLQLNDTARNAVFLRALMDADRDCQEVTNSAFVGQYQGVPAWFATCRNQGEWLVLIGNDGVAQVLSRRGAEAAGIVEPQAGAGNVQQPPANAQAQ